MVECANCKRLEAVIAEQGRALEELRKKVEELEEKANQNSSNSHKPPSSDFGSKRGYAKRKRGGQPGHPGKSREMCICSRGPSSGFIEFCVKQPFLQKPILPWIHESS